MSGKITRTFCPFDRRFTIGLTISTHFVSHHSVAPFTGFYDGITSPTIIGAAALLHEDAFCSYLYGLTNHVDLPPFLLNLFLKLVEIIKVYKIGKEHKKKSYQLSVTRFGV
jgi:hypothetical protein